MTEFFYVLKNNTMHYRYAGFFHFKSLDTVPLFVEWLASVSVEYAWSLEKLGQINVTDQHIQWCIRTEVPWAKDWSNSMGVNGRPGKYLVNRKIANAGEKDAKRWSKIDCAKKGYDWMSSLLYVFKDCTKDTPDTHYGWWSKDGSTRDVKSLFGKHHDGVERDKRKQGRLKAMSFTQQLLVLWEENGKPRTERDCFKLLCEHVMLNKWNYLDGRMIRRAARWLWARADTPRFVDRMMAEFDEGKFDI